MGKECSNKKHHEKKAYRYCCKKCYPKCSKQNKPLPSGNWCDCKCHHNTFTCTICWKPVKLIGGVYWCVK